MPERTRVTLDRDEALARLRRRGGRVTQARRAIIDVLAEAGGHLTADEIIHTLEQRDALVHRATIYRTLDALERVGIIEHVHIGHSSATYHLAGSLHFHLLCEQCGTVTEIPEDVFAPAIALIEERWGFYPRLSHFAIVGTCATCTAHTRR